MVTRPVIASTASTMMVSWFKVRRFKCGLNALRVAMISVMVRLGSDAGRCGKHRYSTFSDHPPLPRTSKITHADWRRYCNIQSSVYWSGTEYAPDPVDAWYFVTHYGGQSVDPKGLSYYAWAVRSGDVGAGGSVPEPGIIGLMGIGALAWAGTWQKRRG